MTDSPRPDFARSLLSAVLLIALAIGSVGAVVDVALLLFHSVNPRTQAAVAGIDFALAPFIALAAAPPWIVARAFARRARRSRSRVAAAWPLAIVFVGFGVGLLLSDAMFHPNAERYVSSAAVFALLLGGLAWMAATPRLAPLLLVATALLVAGDATMGSFYDRSLHDLSGFLTAAAVAASFQRFWPQLRSSPGKLALMVAGALAIGLGGARVIDREVPGWRAIVWQRGAWQPRLGRTLRALVDFDGDGSSPIAWGGDCDDFDETRNPTGRDHDGVDGNCNGTVAPAHPTDEDRGLAPPAGDPREPAGAIDRVILITIDCMRADALTAANTPRLSELSHTGIFLSRSYSPSTTTIKSMPLALHPREDGPPIGEQLLQHGILTTAIFALYSPILNQAVFPGFGDASAPHANEGRWSAEQVTAKMRASIDHAGARRQFLWAHFLDAHYPVAPASDAPALSGTSEDRRQYARALFTIDREIGGFVDWLKQSGRWQRTLLIVTADHGESFGEHGVALHGAGAYEGVVHVPALLIAPDVRPLWYESVVTGRDLPATVLGAFGLDPMEQMGRSWLRLRAAPRRPLHRFVVVRSLRAPTGADLVMPMAAIVDDRYKLLVTFQIGLDELYAPTVDPAEHDDLLPLVASDAARLDRELALYRDIDRYP